MGIYIFIALLLLTLYCFRKTNSSFVWLSAALFVGLSALRSPEVGIDHIAYMTGFLKDIPTLPFSALTFKWEVGWIVLNEIAINTWNDWRFMLLIIACLTVLPFVFVLKKETPDPLLAVILYLLFYYLILPFSLVKQGVAISLFMLAIYYFRKSQNWQSLLSFAAACSIHYSAILMAPFVFIAGKIHIKPKTAVIILSATFVLGLIGFDGPVRSLIEMLPYEKYQNYADYKSDVKFSRLNFYLSLLPKNIACALIFLYLKQGRNKLYKNLLFFGMVLGNLFITISLISRFVIYTYPFEIILLTRLVYQYQGRKRVIACLGVLAYALLYFIYSLQTNRGGVMPYEFYF
mgnify:CR=1 FL=1